MRLTIVGKKADSRRAAGGAIEGSGRVMMRAAASAPAPSVMAQAHATRDVRRRDLPPVIGTDFVRALAVATSLSRREQKARLWFWHCGCARQSAIVRNLRKSARFHDGGCGGWSQATGGVFRNTVGCSGTYEIHSASRELAPVCPRRIMITRCVCAPSSRRGDDRDACHRHRHHAVAVGRRVTCTGHDTGARGPAGPTELLHDRRRRCEHRRANRNIRGTQSSRSAYLRRDAAARKVTKTSQVQPEVEWVIWSSRGTAICTASA